MIAKRGDLVALVSVSHGYVIGQGSTEHTTVGLGIVSSITRDGVVKAVRDVWTASGERGTARPLRVCGRERALIVQGIDVDAALTAFCERRYPTAPDSTMVPPFESVDAAKAFLRPFLIERAA